MAFTEFIKCVSKRGFTLEDDDVYFLSSGLGPAYISSASLF